MNYRLGHAAALIVFGCFFSLAGTILAEGEAGGSYAEGSAEAAALGAAAKYAKGEDFTLRQEYWDGDIGVKKGKAVRLQFFSQAVYRLFFAAPAEGLPAGAKLNVKVVDREMREVASASSKAGLNVVALKVKPKKTGLYMVLLAMDVPEGTEEDAAAKGEEEPEKAVRCVLFYGYE